VRVRTVRPVSIIKEEIASKGIVLMQKPAPTDFSSPRTDSRTLEPARFSPTSLFHKKFYAAFRGCPLGALQQ